MRVVDASIAAKWVVAEAGSDAARRVLEGPGPLIAPDLLVAEVGNVLWKKVTRRAITRRHAQEAIIWLPELFDRLFDSAALAPRALELAVGHGATVYDSLYVALAEAAGREAVLVTADPVLQALASQAGMPRQRLMLVPVD
ncbi:MAG: type II toxin-antitoxin system VapC family toxin [Chromatiales bacterium]|jgi:predicted nucleic acid-binding protein|nr:type II toxin-antitoxin system VapC family toxin [Chromatiales bacterium]